MIETNKIYNEDCMETMKRMPDNFIDLTVTSPPYDNLRTYTGESEWNFQAFIPIANELYRVTKEGGVLVWVVGDATIKGSETGSSFRQALYFMRCGFKLHDTMIYEKSSFPFPSSNRYHQVFEYMFVLSKGKPQFFNPIKDTPSIYAGYTVRGKNTKRQADGSLIERPNKKPYSEFKMRHNIWRFSTGKNNSTPDKEAYKHPAIFPEHLAEDHIISWSNENDIVYDPFMGSGTTAKMALINKRKFIGSEISKEYCEISKERLSKIKEDFE